MTKQDRERVKEINELSVDEDKHFLLSIIDKQDTVVEAARILANEAPSSVEYSDWPELQKAVEDVNDALEELEREK